MADSPDAFMPDVTRGPSAPAAAGQAVAIGFSGVDAPTNSEAQASDPGRPPRFSQVTSMSAEDTSGEMA